MRPIHSLIDLGPDVGKVRCVRYEVDELGTGYTAPRSYPKAWQLAELLSMMRSHPEPGPLMKACLRDAEHHGRGGHRHGPRPHRGV